MEFFDFTGTNEEEKAQVLDIISHKNSSGVEFFLTYNGVSQVNSVDNFKSYSYVNGDHESTNGEIYPLTSYQDGNELSELPNNVASYDNSHANWDPVSNSVSLANATAPIVCPSQYPLHYPNTPQYFVPPPNIYGPIQPHPAVPPMAPHTVTSNQSKDYSKFYQMPSHSSNNVSTPSATHKNSSKVTTSSAPNCDNRSFYMTPQYSEAPQMLDTSRHNATVSGENGMESNGIVVSTGSAVGVHLPLGYFTPTTGFFTHGTHFPGPYIQYHPNFVPYPCPSSTNHMPIAAHPHHPHFAMAQGIDPNLPSGQPGSGVHLVATPSSTNAPLSNLSSSISASSTSIPAAYHSLHSSTSGTPSYEPTDDSSSNPNSYHYPSETSNDSIKAKDLVDMEMEAAESAPSRVINEYQSGTKEEIVMRSPSSTLPISDTNSHVQTFLPLDSLEMSYRAETTTEAAELAENIAENLVLNQHSQSDEIQLNSNLVSSDITPRPPSSSAIETSKPSGSTWASILFPPSLQISMQSNESVLGKPTSVDSKYLSSDTESKSSVSNGDYPELNVPKTFSVVNANSRKSRVAVDNTKVTVVPAKNDPFALTLAKRLCDSISLKHSLPTFIPHGMRNRGNWCYVNATLQALLTCPPFYNLMQEISETPGLLRSPTSTPTIDKFASYFSSFIPTDFKRPSKSSNIDLEDLLNSHPQEPTLIYDTLQHIGMIKNDAQRGHQEDAEEFLSSVLNGLHEEMISLFKLLTESNDSKLNGKSNGFGSSSDSSDKIDLEDEADLSDSNDNIWREVGTSKHKALPTRSTKIVSTFITEIFGGTTLDIRTVNKDKDSCGNRQPFFTLQLNIKQPDINNLEDAIRLQTRPEIIHGYICSKTKQTVEASSQMFLETLPPILIFHLKLFEYDLETGAERKLMKRIDFTENLEIPKECVTGRVDGRYRRYKLLAVVYHIGSEAVNGHYITDVYHLGLNQWLRCDDANIKVISLSKVISGGEGNLVPYLLFYRRFDTLHSSASSCLNSMPANHPSHHTGAVHKHRSPNTEPAQPFNNHPNSHTSGTEAINTSNKFSSISRHY